MLQHAYPPPPHICPAALVDVNILLSTLKSTDTQIGEWVNVMGYLEEKDRGSKNKKGRGRRERGDVSAVRVQAVMLWSAGSVKLGEYEKAALGRKMVENGNGLLR